ncbi:MAG: hypothetical protein ACK5BN_19120, partial [Planctomycetota bacterium]
MHQPSTAAAVAGAQPSGTRGPVLADFGALARNRASYSIAAAANSPRMPPANDFGSSAMTRCCVAAALATSPSQAWT